MAVWNSSSLHGNTNSDRDHGSMESFLVQIDFLSKELFIPNRNLTYANSLDMRPTLWFWNDDTVTCLCTKQYSWIIHRSAWSHAWLEYVSIRDDWSNTVFGWCCLHACRPFSYESGWITRFIH